MKKQKNKKRSTAIGDTVKIKRNRKKSRFVVPKCSILGHYTKEIAKPKQVSLKKDMFTSGANIPHKLKYYFCDKDVYFDRLKKYVLDGHDIHKRRIFIDNKADILFVAHLDTVKKPIFYGKTHPRDTYKKLHHLTYNKAILKGDVFHGAGFDDRLGFYTAFSLVYHDFLKADILITDHEETGGTTAQYHTPKDYNWVCEFDRRGSDVVTYGKETLLFKDALKEFFTIGHGSFSDIGKLDVNACCFNLGVAYEEAHSQESYVVISDYVRQIALFKLFFNRYQSTRFYFDNEAHKKRAVANNTWWSNQRYDYDYNYGYGYNKSYKAKSAAKKTVKKYSWFDVDAHTKTQKAKEETLKRCCQFCYGESFARIYGKRICLDCLYFMIEQSGIEKGCYY